MVTLGLGRHCSSSLLAISISLIVHGSVQAADKEVEAVTAKKRNKEENTTQPNKEVHCNVTQRNLTVTTTREKHACGDGCCFDKADHLLYCSTPRGCENVKKDACLVPICMSVIKTQEQEGWWTNWIFVAVVWIFSVTTTAYRKYKATRKLKEREIMVRKTLDIEFPPTVYGKVANVECKSDDGHVCCICLDGLEGTIVRKLHCSHVLHQRCFDKWCLHSSDRKGRDTNMPEKLSWACPLCKHPAMHEHGSSNPGEVSGDEQPEVIVEQPPTQLENSIPRSSL